MTGEGARLYRTLMRAAPHAARTWSESLVLSLVALTYEAAGDPSRWHDLLTRLQDALGAVAGGFVYHDFANARGGLSLSVRMDPAFVDSYHRYYSSIEPGARDAEPLLRAAPVFGPMDVFVPRQKMLRTEFYADWLRPQRILNNLSGAILYDGSAVSGFDLYRPRGAEPFGPSECGLLHLLMPHLRRAVELHQRLEGFGALYAAAEDVLEGIELGIVLFDGAGRTVSANRAARRILASADGLRSSDGSIRAVHPVDEAALQAAIRGAAQTGAGTGLAAGGAFAIRRASGWRPYAVTVSPLRMHDPQLVDAGTVGVLFVGDPDERAETDVDLLQRLYGLTPAEARVCALCAAGEPAEAIADALGTSKETTRTQIKRVLQKAGSRRQPDLVRVIAQGLAGARRARRS